MNYRYDRIIGTGGIGKGMLFLTGDNRTLGRSESRLVELSDAKDYCKLHIVFHYIAALLTPGVLVVPIGCVGADSIGDTLIEEMREAGMDMRCVARDPVLPTALSICLQYPDKDGFNFTASNGAGSTVTPDYIRSCMERLQVDEKTIVAAIPEVPMESRTELLRLGRRKGGLCVLSVTAGEAVQAKELGLFHNCGLLAVNKEEAEAIIGRQEKDAERTARDLYGYAACDNPDIRILVTCGKDGAYAVDRLGMEHIPSIPAVAVNTTGAGDALLGGMIAGLALGYPFRKGRSDRRFAESPLSSAAELGCICAGMAIESKDSIARGVTEEAIAARIKSEGWVGEKRFRSILKG